VDSAQFDFIRGLVYDRAAIVLEPAKEYLIQTRLAPIARQEGLGSVEVLLDRLQRETAGPVHARVVEAMTTNETSFFRDIGPFDALKKHVLPDLIKKRTISRRLAIWSAASSTGQEIYSIAMLLKENFPELSNGWKVILHATDFSTEMVERARRGVFSQLEVNRGLPAPLLVKYFKRNGAEWEIREDLRKMIEFRQLNLKEQWPGINDIDAVFMRNVLIYFDVPTKKKILGTLPRVMRPDGFLFLGAAETTLGIEAAFHPSSLEKTLCYQLKRS
jgi:chemotaxis protein methyltransferase CheR